MVYQKCFEMRKCHPVISHVSTLDREEFSIKLRSELVPEGVFDYLVEFLV